MNDRIDKYGLATGIGVERDGVIVGAAIFNNYNGACIDAHFASNGKKNWITREFLRFSYHYIFNQCGVKRVSGFIAESNKPAVNLARRLGGDLEAVLVDACEDGNVLVFKMMRDECKWI